MATAFAFERCALISEESLGRHWTLQYWISYDGRYHALISRGGAGFETGFPKSTKAEARAEVEATLIHHYGWLPWLVALPVAERTLRDLAPGKTEQEYFLMMEEMFGNG